jgi:ferredoxin-NADP reductase
MTAMTANASNSTWDDLYRTSLFFINREKKAEATPYREGKTKNGYPCISFEMKEQDGWKDRYYTLIQAPDKSALALSVKIPSKADEKTYLANFQRMVDTTKFK